MDAKLVWGELVIHLLTLSPSMSINTKLGTGNLVMLLYAPVADPGLIMILSSNFSACKEMHHNGHDLDASEGYGQK